MRIVLDTNVLVSALITRWGNCAAILEWVGQGVIQPCVDERILCEYEAVLHRPEFHFDVDDVAALLDLIRKGGQVVVPTPLAVALPDLDDLPFLEVAAWAKAILVTGNLRHFPVRFRGPVTVVSPQEFLHLPRGTG